MSDPQRKAWTTVAAGAGAWLCVGVIGWLVWMMVFAPGCVSAGYKSGTTTYPDGRKDTYRSATYTDMREGAKGAMDFMGGLGDGLLGSGGMAGLLSGGGVVGALGLLWRNSAVNKARKQAHDDGWDARERAAMVQQPLPKPDHGTGVVSEVKA